MKKYSLLIILILLLTGCTVNYNLNIDENGLYEDLNMIKDETDQDFNNYLKLNAIDKVPININDYEPDIPYMIEGITYYEDKITDNNKSYSYLFNKDNFADSTIINDNTKKFTYLKGTTNYLKAELDPNIFLKYPEISDLKITINTKYNVINTNTKNIKNNKYTWIFNKDSKDYSIELNYKEELKKEKDNAQKNTALILILPLSLIIITCAIFLYIKYKNSDN